MSNLTLRKGAACAFLLAMIVVHPAAAAPAQKCVQGHWKSTSDADRAYINPQTGLLEYQSPQSDGGGLARVGFQAALVNLTPGTYDVVIDVDVGRVQAPTVLKLQLVTAGGGRELASQTFPETAKNAVLRKRMTIEAGTAYAVLETRSDTKIWFFARPAEACLVQ